jgi:N-acetylneuraminic acid mutarotase
VVFEGKFWVYGGHTPFFKLEEEDDAGDSKRSRDHECKDLFRYDPACNSWTLVEPKEGSFIPRGRSCHSAVVFNRRMYIFGGQVKNDKDELEATKDFLFFDFGSLLE